MARPVVVLPGFLGSVVENIAAIPAQPLWSELAAGLQLLTRFDVRRAALDRDGTSDLADDVLNRPTQLIPTGYFRLVHGLRDRLRVPVFPFPFDWRLSARVVAPLLVELVRELLGRPMRTVAAWDHKLDFVCHSFGGMVMRAFLDEWTAQEPGPLPVGRVAFVSSPNSGSLETMAGMITGENSIFQGHKEMRKIARTYPAIYESLPTYPDAVVLADGTALDPFLPSSWQTSVLAPATEGERDPDGFYVEPERLAEAQRVVAELPLPTEARFGLAVRDLLCVAGAKPRSTTQQVTVRAQPNEPRWYDFETRVLADGDEVVTVEAARLPGVATAVVHRDDLSYILDAAARFTLLHAFLPQTEEVLEILTRFLTDGASPSVMPRGIVKSRFIAP
jgi:hypothetical protein